MKNNQGFKNVLAEHLNRIQAKLLKSSNELLKRAAVHDQDKIFNPIVNEAYEKHFLELKKIEFGTEEYKNYEKDYFTEAHKIHALNRHHFYSHYNNLDDVNLFDLLEAIIDISESAKQYNSNKTLQETFEDKGLYNYDMKELINNTIKFLNED